MLETTARHINFNSTNSQRSDALPAIWPDRDMNMMMNDNNYYITQLTTLDITRRIRASEPLDSAEFFAYCFTL